MLEPYFSGIALPSKMNKYKYKLLTKTRTLNLIPKKSQQMLTFEKKVLLTDGYFRRFFHQTPTFIITYLRFILFYKTLWPYSHIAILWT